MRLTQKLTLLSAVLTLAGCRSRSPIPEEPMPPNTVLLSEMMRELSAEPGFTETLLQQLEGAKASSTGKKGPALLTPRLIDELRKRILGKDWQGLDRFPGWTMREINPTVRVADKLVGKDPALEGLSAVHPGAPAPSLNDRQVRLFLDLGPYPLDREQAISLNEASDLPGFPTTGSVTPLGKGVVRGDGPDELAPEHSQSQRLANVLNRLSANGLNDVRPFTAISGERRTATPEGLIDALVASGHTVSVTDARYFANFGHLHYKGQDVMMPFWINTQIAVPGSGGFLHRSRPLLVPVSHAEYEWHIRGPHVNADVSHYFGVDGKAEWRTMDTLDQAWVLKRDAHTYTGAQAVEVTRLIGLITLAYMHQHARRPTLSFGGYYTLGVCQDPVSAVEKKLTGKSTLFPNTADSTLFDDPRDGEVNALFASIPKDRAGSAPPPERIFGSLPADPGSDNSFSSVSIPGLASDLNTTYSAWQTGRLRRTPSSIRISLLASIAALLIAAGAATWKRLRRTRR